MKYGFVGFMILLCCVLPATGAGQASAPAKPLTSLEQALMSAEMSFVDAAKKGDVAFFKRTLTGDFSFVAFDEQLYSQLDMLDPWTVGGVHYDTYDMMVH